MFARLLTPHGATAAATDIFKSLDATAEAAAAQVGLENGFGQCDRTAAAAAAGGGGGGGAAEETRMDDGGEQAGLLRYWMFLDENEEWIRE